MAGDKTPIRRVVVFVRAFVRARLQALVAKRQTPLRGANLPARPGHAKPHRAKVLPEEFRRTISREEIASLPIRRYEGEVSVVNTPLLLAAAMRDIRQERVLGFDRLSSRYRRMPSNPDSGSEH